MRSVVAALLVLVVASCSSRPRLDAPASAPHALPPHEVRAAYIRDLGALLDDAAAVRRLERRIDDGTLTVLVPYGLGPLFAGRRELLVRWLSDMRARGVRVIAPVAGKDRVAELVAFGIDRFDGFVTELEYWNRVDRAAALDELLAVVAGLREAGARQLGAYLGYPAADEAERIAGAVDFVFLNYSVADPTRAWAHVRAGQPLAERFGWFARRGVAVWPIFYAEGEVDMRAALEAGGLRAAEAAFRRDVPADLRVAGFVYFTAERLPP